MKCLRNITHTATIAFILLVAGCGSNSAPAPPSVVPKFAYVTNNNPPSVSAFRVDAAVGALTSVAGSPFAAGDYPNSIVLHPKGKFVYTGNTGSFDISGYSIDENSGALTPIPGSPFPTGNNPFAVAVHASGDFLYVTNVSVSNNVSTGTISAYSIDASTGVLAEIVGSPFPAGQLPSSLTQDRSGKFLYSGDVVAGQAIRHGGGIVCAEIVQAGGSRSVMVINKYERRPAYAYDGTLIIPLKEAQYTVTMNSIERGVTGARDALVTSQLAEQGELEIESAAAPGEPGRIKGWFQDPYDPSYQGSSIYSMSDDDRLDALFPDHPLSKIRKSLRWIQATLVIDQAILRDTILAPSSTGEEEPFTQPRRLLSSPTVASLYLLVGSSRLEMGRFDDAEKLFDISISELERAVGKNDPLVAKHLFLLGLAHDCQGRYLDAESVLSRARGIFEQSLGQDDLHTAQTILNLARVYLSLGRHDEAEPLFLHVLRVFNEKDPSGSNAGIALNGLGLVCNERGLYLEAIPYFEQALHIFERVHGPEFTDCATVLRNMALSLRNTGDDRRAEEALNRARRING